MNHVNFGLTEFVGCYANAPHTTAERLQQINEDNTNIIVDDFTQWDDNSFRQTIDGGIGNAFLCKILYW